MKKLIALIPGGIILFGVYMFLTSLGAFAQTNVTVQRNAATGVVNTRISPNNLDTLASVRLNGISQGQALIWNATLKKFVPSFPLVNRVNSSTESAFDFKTGGVSQWRVGMASGQTGWSVINSNSGGTSAITINNTTNALSVAAVPPGLTSDSLIVHSDGTDELRRIAPINTILSPYAPLASPALTGVPTAPTASSGTNTTQLATTAFVSNSISTAGAGYIPNSQKGAANGVATLNASGKVPNSQIPAIAISETFEVASEAAMLTLSSAEQGDIAVRSDVNKSFILKDVPASTLSNWVWLKTPTDAVLSVNGTTGAVTLNSLTANYGLISDGSYNGATARTFSVDTASTNALVSKPRLASSLALKQNALSGTGFVKALGTTISYDTNTYLTSSTGVSSITGTTNQVTASSSTGSVTLSLPQSIATTSTPTFGGLTLTGPSIMNNGQFYQARRSSGNIALNVLGFSGDDLIQTTSDYWRLRNTAGTDLAVMSNSGAFSVTASITAPTARFSNGASIGYVWTATDALGNGAWVSAASAYKGTWNASTNTPTLADGVGTIGDEYDISTGGTQFGRTFVTGGRAKYNGSIWQPIGTSAAVTSVFGRTGSIMAQAGDYSKSDVGLSNVDNTSDASKPVSTATQNALDLKANLASPALTGTPTAPTASGGTNNTQIATTAFVQGLIANYIPLSGGTSSGTIKANAFQLTDAASTNYYFQTGANYAEWYDGTGRIRLQGGNTILTGSLSGATSISTTGNITLNNGQYLQAKRNTGGVTINVLGFESGTDILSLTTSDNFKIKNTGGSTLFDLTNSGGLTITGAFSSSNVSGNNTGDNATNSTSNAYADAKVQNSLSASTTIAPSATAVNTALATKQDALGFTPYNSTNPNGFITSSALSPYALISSLGTAAFTASSDYKASSYVPSWSEVTGKPTLFSGAYADLSGKPTIPTAVSQLTNDSGYITSSALASYAPLASPALTGNPTAPTQTAGDNSTKIATTAYVTNAVSASGITTTGEYVPTCSAYLGVSSLTPRTTYYTKTGDRVRVDGTISVNSSSTGPNAFKVSLPFASDLDTIYDLTGVAGAHYTTTTSGVVWGETVDNVAIIRFQSTATTGTEVTYSFTYKIK